jgi:hypothetical protein
VVFGVLSVWMDLLLASALTLGRILFVFSITSGKSPVHCGYILFTVLYVTLAYMYSISIQDLDENSGSFTLKNKTAGCFGTPAPVSDCTASYPGRP